MAGIKISALPAIPSSQATDFGPFVQGGITYKATIAQITALLNSTIVLGSTSQVTGLATALAGFLPLAGGTMLGNLILNTDPTLPLQAATKAYVDTVAAGFQVVLAAQAATTANLNATQAGAGIGATLTNAGTQAAFAVDGYTASINDRILVKNQTLTQHNGIYTVTTLGSGSSNWVLTRASDYDTNTQIVPGTLIAANNGTVNANTSWLETATVAVVDTDPVLFSQFTFAPGQFLQVANNLSDVANIATSRTNLGLTGAAIMSLPVSLANGGTGQTLGAVNNAVFSSNGSGNAQLSATLPSGLLATNMNLTTPLITTSLKDVNGVTWVAQIPIASAVNYPAISNNITGSAPSIGAEGSDTNIYLNLLGKGTGGVAVQGTKDGSNAGASFVGEFVSSTVLSASAVVLATNTAANVTSISLSAGDWDIFGNVTLTNVSSLSQFYGWCSLTSATAPDVALRTAMTGLSANIALGTPLLRVNVTSTTTVYLSTLTVFTGSARGCGSIFARRVR